MSTQKSLRSIITLSLALVVLLGYSFISAWTAPTGTAPNNNVAAPINVGTSTATVQSGYGSLAFDQLVSFGDTQTYGTGKLIGAAPTIEFNDNVDDGSGASNNLWWLHSNAYAGSKGRIHFLYDRNDNAAWDAGDITPSMVLESGATVAEDYALFSNQVRATKFCNSDGSVCATVDEMLATVAQNTPNEIVYLPTPFNMPGSGSWQTTSYTLNMTAPTYPSNVIKIYVSGYAQGSQSQGGGNQYTGIVSYTVPGIPNSGAILVSGGYNSSVSQSVWILLGAPKTVTFNFATPHFTTATARLLGYECQGACQ